MAGRSVLFSEMDLQNTVSPIFRDMLQVAPRRPPTLKKVKRKPPKEASFATVPKDPPTEEDLLEQDEEELAEDVNSDEDIALDLPVKKRRKFDNPESGPEVMLTKHFKLDKEFAP